MNNIDDILAGMEKQTWWLDLAASLHGDPCDFVSKEPHESPASTNISVVDKAYANRLEALCRKLYEQRNDFIKFYALRSTVSVERATEMSNAELTAIVRGDKGRGDGR